MKTLLLLSKAIALEDGAQTVTLSHFGQALAYGRVTDARARQLLSHGLGKLDEPPQVESPAPDVMIEQARQAPPIRLAPELRDLLRRLEAGGDDYFVLKSDEQRPPGVPQAARIERLLKSNLLGQDKVIAQMVTTLISRTMMQSPDRRGVAAAFILAGPTASGKSLMARLLAEGLGDYPVLELDCSSFDSPNERFVFDGSPTAYTGARPGQLTSFVRENPRCVVVLDHFSRMNPTLQTVLLPVLETGKLRDNYGFYKNDDSRNGEEVASRDVDFSQVYLILTTDAGADLYDHPTLIERLEAEGGMPQVSSALQDILRTTRNETSYTPGPAFDAAVLSRVFSCGAGILFSRLGFDPLRQLCARNLRSAAEMLLGATGGGIFELGSHADTLIDLLVLAQGGQADARKFENAALAQSFFAPLTQHWMDGDIYHRIRIQMHDTDAMAVQSLMASLGPDPLRTLFRQMKRVQFDIEVTHDANCCVLFGRAPRLVKIASPADFHGSGGLLVEAPAVRFGDIAGYARLKDKLARQISLLRDADKLAAHGLRPPGGLLLHGPAGTGKTSIARALAGESGLPFLAVTAPELLDLDFQRRLFEKLRRYAPAILFIDEIDALGRRGGGLDPAINTLLAEIDGFGTHDVRIFVVGATNFPEKVDPALLRPGRMELCFEVGLPDRAARQNLLRRCLPNADDALIERMADLSSGMSGAAIEAARRDFLLLPESERTDSVFSELTEILNTVRFGTLESIPESLRKQVAIHEAGHAVVLFKLCHETDRVDCVRITGHGATAGHVACTRMPEESPAKTRRQVKNELMALLAGRTAQVLCFGEEDGMDNGASNDLSRAVDLATQAIIRWGLDPILGVKAVALCQGRIDGPLPEAIIERIDAWIRDATEAVEAYLAENQLLLEKVAKHLLTERVLDHRQLTELLQGSEP